MIFDTEKTGLETCFLPWQVECWRAVWKMSKPFGSLALWESLETQSRSRASVINFLAWMVNEGLLRYSEVTGKGGYRGQYEAIEDFSDSEHSLKRALNVRMRDHLEEHLPWTWRIVEND